MEWYIHVQNLKNFGKQLDEENDPAKRAILLPLIAEERDKVIAATKAKECRDVVARKPN